MKFALNQLFSDYISKLEVDITDNKCWIPAKFKHWSTRYIRVTINYRMYVLHRMSMCVKYDLNYYDYKIEARHGSNCSNHCFNPDHITPGTSSDNQLDSVRDNTHWQAKKECCSKCGGILSTKTIKSGDYKGKVRRFCKACKVRQRSAVISRRRRIAKNDSNSSGELS